VLTRLLSFVAVLVLACASTTAHATARAPERVSAPLSEQLQEWKSARRGSAEVPATASNEPAALGDCRVGKNWHPPLKVTSDPCLYAYANPTVWVDVNGREVWNAQMARLNQLVYETDPARREAVQKEYGTESVRQNARFGATMKWAQDNVVGLSQLSSTLLQAYVENSTFGKIDFGANDRLHDAGRVIAGKVAHPIDRIYTPIHDKYERAEALEAAGRTFEAEYLKHEATIDTGEVVIGVAGLPSLARSTGRLLGNALRGAEAFLVKESENGALAMERARAANANVDSEFGPLNREPALAETESAANKFDVTDAVSVSGRNATERAASFEEKVRDMYGAAPLSRRTYAAPHNFSGVGRADNVAQINGREVAIEAKYTDDWAKSPFNPDSKLPWAAAERARMLNQARNYNSVFDDIIYHTNSVDLATYYSGVLPEAGVTNFKFIVTPVTK